MNKHLLTDMIKNCELELTSQKLVIDSYESQLKIFKEHNSKTKKQLDDLKNLMKSLDGKPMIMKED